MLTVVPLYQLHYLLALVTLILGTLTLGTGVLLLTRIPGKWWRVVRILHVVLGILTYVLLVLTYWSGLLLRYLG